MKRVLIALEAALLLFVVSCGGGGGGTPPPTVHVSVSPTTASLIAGATQQFTATVSGTTNTAVTWSCSGTACGSITAAGLYTAPSPIPASATVTITATSAADATKTGTAAVTHIPVAVSISPATSTLFAEETRQMTATVTGHSNTAVTWSVTGGGTISSTGLYTAPPVVPTQTSVTITAVSQFDNTKAATATLTLMPLSIAVSPTAQMLDGGTSAQLTATITGHSNTAVTWSTSGPGSVSATGLYTAPPFVAAQTAVTVTATSQADATKSISATITINPVAVAVTAKTATLSASQTEQFHAAVTGSLDTGVTWSVSGTACAGAGCGSVDASGMYTAPASVAGIFQTKTVHASAGPWAFVPGGLNTNYQYGAQPGPPTVFSDSDGFCLAAGSRLTVAYASGLWCSGTYVSVGTCRDANGYSAFPANDSQAAGVYAPSKYIDPANFPIYILEMVGTFADNSGGIVGSPFVIGNGPVTLTVPNGATRLQLGSNAYLNYDARDFFSPLQAEVNGSGLVVTVTATSSVDPSKSDSATVVLNGISITLSPETATVNINQTQQFAATVEGTANTAVNWSVSCGGSSGDVCGTISSTGLYTAPAAVPNPELVRVIARSAADPTKGDSARVRVINNPNLKLNATYAFTYAGYDGIGNALYMIGSFTADGNGHLTNGLADINGVTPGYRNLKAAFTGTYQMNASDNRGQMTFNLPTGAATFRFAVSSTASSGWMMRFENTGQYGSGEFRVQNAAELSLNNLSGDYVMAMFGSSQNGERNGVLGRMHANGAGTISAGEVDSNNVGGPATNTTFTGSLAMNSTTGIANGRGIMTANVVGLGSLEFSFYMVGSDEVYLLSTAAVGSDTPLLTGRLLEQTGGPFSNSSFSGKSVFYGAGVTGSPARAAVIVGQFNANGSGYSVAEYATNWGGLLTVGGDFTMDYSIAANGRGSWTGAGTTPHVFYLVAPNKGFFMQYTTPGANVILGFFEQQSAGPFDLSTLQGEYVDSVFAATTYDVPYGVAIGNFSGNGSLTGIGDYSNRGGNYSDLPSSGTYTIANSTTGRAELVGNDGNHLTVYIISSSKFVYIPNNPAFVNPPLQIVQK